MISPRYTHTLESAARLPLLPLEDQYVILGVIVLYVELRRVLEQLKADVRECDRPCHLIGYVERLTKSQQSAQDPALRDAVEAA
jgi:hypothetical protein